MRKRVEDLGRLAVLLRNMLDHELFEGSFIPGRPKDYYEWFSGLSEEKKMRPFGLGFAASSQLKKNFTGCLVLPRELIP